MLEGRATVLNQLDFLLKLTASVGTGQGVNAGFNFDVLCSYSGSSSRVMDMTEGDPTPFLWRHLAMQQVSCLTASPNIRQFRQFFNFRHHASQFCFASTLHEDHIDGILNGAGKDENLGRGNLANANEIGQGTIDQNGKDKVSLNESKEPYKMTTSVSIGMILQNALRYTASRQRAHLWFG